MAPSHSNLVASPLADEQYIQYLADLILEHVTEQGKITHYPDVYRAVSEVTGRTVGTVKNWLAYRTHTPDTVSLARIVEHWNIAPASVYPPFLSKLLAGVPPGLIKQVASSPTSRRKQPTLVSLYGPNDRESVTRVLDQYTEQPESTIFLPKEGRDMVDEIRPDELMLVDTSFEQVETNGIYVLRFDKRDGEVVIRHVDRLLGQPQVRLRAGSSSKAVVEVLPLVNGAIRHVTVLGRVVGVLRQL